MTYQRILKSTGVNHIIAHVVKRHGCNYHFRLTRNMSVDDIKTYLRQDTWDTALWFHHFGIQAPGFVAKTQKELIQMVYEKVFEITGSGETAMNTPIFLFDQDKGRWQMTVPKWPGPRFYDRTYLSGLTKLDFGHFRTIDWRWDYCFISRLARARDLRRLIKYTRWENDVQDAALRDFCERILADLPNRKGGFVGYDYELKWDDDDKCWRNDSAVHKIGE